MLRHRLFVFSLLVATALLTALPDKVAVAAESSTSTRLVRHLLASGNIAHADRVVVADLEFEDVSGHIQVRDGLLILSKLTGRAYGGYANGEVSISLLDGSIDIQLELHELQLDDFLMRYASMTEPFTGIISGAVNLNLPQGVGNLLNGSADLRMHHGNVIAIGAVTETLLGSPTARRGQDVAQAVIHIEDRHATFQELTVTSPSVVLSGSGSIAFDGTTDIIFSPRSTPGYLNLLPIAGPMLSWTVGRVTRSLGRFRVSGHISNPQFIARPL